MAEDEKRLRVRPESTIAQNFAADLDSMFGLSPEMEKLTQTVEEKKQTVSSSEQQLHELEARLRETEKRLARVSRQSSPSRPAGSALPRNHPDSQQASEGVASRQHPFAQRPTYPADRPPTAVAEQGRSTSSDPQKLVAGLPGALPETPRQYHNAGNDYVMVENGGQAQRGYG